MKEARLMSGQGLSTVAEASVRRVCLLCSPIARRRLVSGRRQVGDHQIVNPSSVVQQLTKTVKFLARQRHRHAHMQLSGG